MRDYRTDDLSTPLPQGSEVPPLEQLPPGTTRFIDITVYDLPAPEQKEEAASVESDPAPVSAYDEQGAHEDQGEHEPPLATPLPRVPRQRPRRSTRPPRLALLVLVVCFGTAIGLALYALLPVFAASATITIIPVSRQVEATTSVTVVSGTPDPTKQQIAGRALPSLTMSQQGTAPTTGRGHQDAHAATGRITFYNAATAVQTVAAGTLLTGADGVQVVTEQDAVIPAAIVPTEGQATVPAHAILSGPAGNIKAGDMYGACCRLNVFAVNSVFAGGTQARDYRTVTQADLDQVGASLKTSLDQSIQAALQTQVHADETLLTPLTCTAKATPDHQPGDEAVQVHVLLAESCTGLAYQTHASQSLLAQHMDQMARTQLGDGYQPQNDLVATVLHATPQGQGVVLQVHLTQSYGYQFTSEQQARIRALIAGKGKTEAIAALLAVPGVQSVSLSIGNGGTVIPSDTSRIHLAFLVMMG